MPSDEFMQIRGQVMQAEAAAPSEAVVFTTGKRYRLGDCGALGTWPK
jgi:hypothetical protein